MTFKLKKFFRSRAHMQNFFFQDGKTYFTEATEFEFFTKISTKFGFGNKIVNMSLGHGQGWGFSEHGEYCEESHDLLDSSATVNITDEHYLACDTFAMDKYINLIIDDKKICVKTVDELVVQGISHKSDFIYLTGTVFKKRDSSGKLIPLKKWRNYIIIIDPKTESITIKDLDKEFKVLSILDKFEAEGVQNINGNLYIGVSYKFFGKYFNSIFEVRGV